MVIQVQYVIRSLNPIVACVVKKISVFFPSFPIDLFSSFEDVPKWLKNLRLHKYAFFFSQMTYDQMMNLTIDQLKEGKITDGACTKILINIKKLKERQTLLQQYLLDIDNGQIDMKTVLQHLNELMLTPIRAQQENDNDEDLPKLIMQVLEKGRLKNFIFRFQFNFFLL